MGNRKIEWEMKDHDSRMDLENIEVRGGHSRLSFFFFFFRFGIVKIIVGLYAINKGNKGERVLKNSQVS